MRRFAKTRLALPACVGLALAFGYSVVDTEAHKVVTSPYTYNDDIYPILRDSCGRCHVEGGPAPMGLLAWNDGPNSATPWAESIRELIVDEQMPPWYVDSLGPSIRGGSGLTAIQSDKLLVWATGGAPQGDLKKSIAHTTYHARWTGGEPDLKIPMESTFTIAAERNEETREFVLPTGLAEARWVKGVDLLPGAPEIVRNAVVSIDGGAVLAVWVPGDTLVTAPADTAFRVPAGAKLRLQIHYKKQWQNGGKAIADRSVIGLYFAAAPASARAIQSVAVEGPKAPATEFASTLTTRGRVVAIRPSLDKVYGSVSVEAVTPAGAHVPLLRLRNPRPEWRRRYWLASPVELPAGSRILVTRTPVPSYINLAGAALMPSYPLQVAIDFVPNS
ncbi:MAG TPA: hypothetical protein VFY29_01160 [Terriglobia bacterium]|nr:hypothetical protein [Terriglobia bacterium]